MYLLRPHGSGSVRNLAHRTSLSRAFRRLIGGVAYSSPEQMTTPSRLLPRIVRLRAVDQCTRLKEVEKTMQTLAPTHEIDQLSTSVVRAANAAAECVRQVSIRDLTQTELATGAEGILFWLIDVPKALEVLRKGRDASERVRYLEKLKSAANWVRYHVDAHIEPAEKTITDDEVRRAMAVCLSASRDLTGSIERLLSLDQVRGVGMSLRAKVANDNAQAIVAEARKR